MANGWTPERKAAAAALIRERKPWNRSTGPRTAEGKARASRNAFKGGIGARLRELSRQINAQLRELKRITKAV